MKKIILSTVILLLITTISKAQCKAQLKTKFKQNCEGVYLMDKEIKESSNTIKMVLNSGGVYGLYLFNNDTSKMPNFEIINTKGRHIEHFEAFYNDKENYRYIKYKTPIAGVYEIKINFNENEKGCAVFALYYQIDKFMTKDNEKNK